MLKGVGVTGGVVIARTIVLQSDINYAAIPKQRTSDADAEYLRYTLTLRNVLTTLEKLAENALIQFNAEIAAIFDTYCLMLKDDESVSAPIKVMIYRDKYTAEYAILSQFNNLSQVMLSLKNDYLSQRAEDFICLQKQLLYNLVKNGKSFFQKVHADYPFVFVTDHASPISIFNIDPKKLLGFITQKGSYDCHAAILAREMNLPGVVKVPNVFEFIKTGSIVALDAETGEIWVNPDRSIIGILENRKKACIKHEN